MMTFKTISFALAASALALTGCAPSESASTTDSDPGTTYTTADLEDILSDPVKRSEMIVKVMGSTEREDTYAFLKFHIYGFDGGNVLPLFSMQNVIVQKWTPMEEPGYFGLKHYEVAYFSEFDTNTPIETWENPYTGETLDIPPFILGPIEREYTPEGIIAPGIAPNPLNVSIIGDRVFIPTQSIDKAYNPMSGPEWGPYAGDPDIYWDSMLTYSASAEDVLNPELTSVPAEIHMQNLISWGIFMKMGLRPGRTMARAYGKNIESLDDLPPEVVDGLKKYTPDIFETDEWTDLRIDAIDFMNEIRAKIDNGEIVIEPVAE